MAALRSTYFGAEPPAREVIVDELIQANIRGDVRRVAEATGTRRAGPLRPSFYLKGLLPITIDHVLVPEGAVAATAMRPLLGSDHRGQRAVVQLQQGL